MLKTDAKKMSLGREEYRGQRGLWKSRRSGNALWKRWCLLGPSIGFEYLKTGKGVRKVEGGEISDWLLAPVTTTMMLAPGSQRPLQKPCYLAFRRVKQS